MRFFPRLIFAATACIAAAGGVIYWLARANQVERSHPVTQAPQSTPRVALSSAVPGPRSDDVSRPDRAARVFGRRSLSTGNPSTGSSAAVTAQFTDKVRDESSLDEYRQAIAHRAERAKAQLREQERACPSRPHAHVGSGVTGHLDLLAIGVCRPVRRGPRRGGGLAQEGVGALQDAGRAHVGPGSHDGLAGHQRPAPGRAGQLHRLRRPVELHLPDRARGRPHQAVRFARGRRVVLRVSRRMARRPAHPLAAQHRRHDAR